MAIKRSKKEEVLRELTDKFKEAKSIVFAKYSGVSVKNLSLLRSQLRAQEIEYKIAKKTLLKMAAKSAGLKMLPDEFLQGPVGVGFGYKDEIMPAKILHEFSKKNPGLELLCGIINGCGFDKSQIRELATLPPKEYLLAKLIGIMKGPVYGMYGVMHGVLRNFVGVFKAYHDKKD